MLQINQLNGFGSGGAPIEISLADFRVEDTGNTTYTFTNNKSLVMASFGPL